MLVMYNEGFFIFSVTSCIRVCAAHINKPHQDLQSITVQDVVEYTKKSQSIYPMHTHVFRKHSKFCNLAFLVPSIYSLAPSFLFCLLCTFSMVTLLFSVHCNKNGCYWSSPWFIEGSLSHLWLYQTWHRIMILTTSLDKVFQGNLQYAVEDSFANGFKRIKVDHFVASFSGQHIRWKQINLAMFYPPHSPFPVTISSSSSFAAVAWIHTS